MEIYDCHMHSDFSFDAEDTIKTLIEKAISIGARAITITEHPYPMPDGYLPYENLKKSHEMVKELSHKYKDKILVLSGVERDDIMPPDVREPFYELDLDCILASAHTKAVFREELKDSGYTSLSDCVKTESIEFLTDFTHKYYNRLKNMAYYTDADVIAHLTFPFRYINGEGQRDLKISSFYSDIDEVLDGTIKTGKALEVNTSRMATDWQEFMPNAEILKRYHNMGGKHITLGSDAHKKENIAVGFEKAIKMLTKIGFVHGSYFIKRERFEYKL